MPNLRCGGLVLGLTAITNMLNLTKNKQREQLWTTMSNPKNLGITNMPNLANNK
jgi:hypothetical protein